MSFPDLDNKISFDFNYFEAKINRLENALEKKEAEILELTQGLVKLSEILTYQVKRQDLAIRLIRADLLEMEYKNLGELKHD